MSFRPPRLDDRSYDDLVAELIARIPAHTPEWTNPRQGDPGRTLIELFAWLTDTLLYRANLIPERQRLAFLRLLGGGVRPARPARGIVSVLFDDEKQTEAVNIRPFATLKGLLNIGYVPSIELPALFEDVGPAAAIPHVWEISTGKFINGEPEYLTLDRVDDTTLGLAGRGVVRLALPASEFIGAPTNDVREDFRAG